MLCGISVKQGLIAVALLLALANPAQASQGFAALPTTGVLSGLTAVQDINTNEAALLSLSESTSAPTYAVQGALWASTSTVSLYDGTDWDTILDYTTGQVTIPLSNLPSESAYTLLGATSTGSPTAIVYPASCGSSSTALGSTSTGFYCQTITGGGSGFTLAVTTSNVTYSGVMAAVTSGTISTAYSAASYTYNPSTHAFTMPTAATLSVGALALTTTQLGVQYGGTGATTLLTDGILYGNGTSALGVTATSAYSVLTTNSTGVPSETTSIVIGTVAPLTDTGVAIQATTSTNGYYQTILQNTSTGTSASVAYTTAINGTTSTTNYAEFGQNGSLYATGTSALNVAGNGYLDTVGEDMAIGTLTNNALHFTTSAHSTDWLSISGAGAVAINGALSVTATTTFSAPIIANSAISAGTIATSSYVGLNAGGQMVLGAGGAGGSVALNVTTSNVSYSGILSSVTSGASVSTFYSGASYTYNPSTAVFNIGSGGIYEINGTQIALSNLSNGTTGTGTTVVLQGSPTLTTPVIGVATGTSLGLTTTTASVPVNGMYSPSANALYLTSSGNAALELTTTGNVPEVYTPGAFVSGPNALSLTTTIFTPVAVSSNTYRVVLVHATCPCKIANPTGTAADGQKFILEIWQSSSGSDTIGTWDTNYDFGTAGSPTLSTGANKGDFLGFEYSAQNSKYDYLGIQQGM